MRPPREPPVVAVASAVGDRGAAGEPAPVLAVHDGSATLHLAPGDQLVARGDVADDVYVVVSGQLEVVLERATGTQQVSLLGPDDVIGEIGLLAGDARTATVRAVTACELVAISGDELRRIVAEDPERGRRLHRQATERLRRTLLIEQLTNLFGVIDQDVLGTIEHLIEWVAVPAGSLVFAEGDVGDAAYLVAVGRLRVLQRSRSGGGLVEVGEVTRSGLVGELSLLDGQPRRASVCAVRDSQLVRLSRAAYEELLQRYPEVGLTVAQTVLQLLNAGPRDARADRPLSVAVVATSARVDLDTFARQLTVALGDEARRLTPGVIDEDLGRAGAAEVGEEEVGALRLAYHLEDLEQRHRRLVYQVGEVTTEWGRRALHSVDRILLVASSEDDAAPGRHERDLWQSLTGEHHPEVRLALLHPAGTLLPSGTAAWLDTRDLAGHHHLRDGDATHIGRLARLLAGTATSLVLGGGGARGFAHIGVLDVLEELDEPVDMVAGTSIGAIMAAGPGMGWTAAEMRTTAVDAFRNLFDYTLPTTSLLRGERITKKLWQRFGEARIEDMWLPYFCVSTNLTRAAVEFHDRGLLVPALRASIAIPGVLPPVPRDGDLLVDGGVLDNLPVEEMRRRNPSGRVVAIDVSLNDGPVAERDFGLSVSGGRAYLARRRGGGPPHLLATMVRSTLVAGARDRERAIDEKLADLYVEVAVDGGALLDFSAGSDIADSSMATTRPILKEWFSTVTPARTVVRTKPARRSIVQPGRRRHRRGVLLLTLRDLQHRASRFGAVIVGTSVVFALLYVMTGLTEQFHREPRDMVEALGADGWVVREGATGAFTSAATMPADTAGAVTGAGAAPVVVGRHALNDGSTPVDVVLVGFTAGTMGEPTPTEGRVPTELGEVAIDESAGLEVGDEAVLGSERYRVTGLTTETTLFAGMPAIFLPIESAQALLYRGQDLASAVLVGDGGAAVPEGFVVLSPEAVAADATRPLERSITSVNLIRILLWFVAAMIIGTMVYLSALERRRDVAVLKAVGASTVQLGTSIAVQGVLVALVAALIAGVLQLVLVPVFPLTVSVPQRALLQVPAIAVVVALVAGLAGLRSAVRTDPALAFSGPGS